LLSLTALRLALTHVPFAAATLANIQVNEYELLRELGAGATAVVKLCRRVGAPRVDEDGGGNGVLYAVKIFQKSVLRKQIDFGGRPGEMVRETGLHKLQREIAIMKKLIHPNIVRLIEVIDDTAGDCGYLVMEYVSGKQFVARVIGNFMHTLILVSAAMLRIGVSSSAILPL
jgi:serine/threonine protein kinase